LVYSGVIVFQIYFLLHGKYNPRPLERPVGWNCISRKERMA
jgi:hypothetical protein